jgi:signal transduction histidine kinase
VNAAEPAAGGTDASRQGDRADHGATAGPRDRLLPSPRSAARSGWIIDTTVVVVVAALDVGGVWAELAAWHPAPGFPAGAYLLALATAAALFLRRRRPFACVLVVFALVAAYHLAGYPGEAPAMALFVALYTLAERAESVWWIAVAILVVPAWQLLTALPPNGAPPFAYAVAGPAIGMLCLIVLGAATRRLRAASALRVRLARREADSAANERIAQERLRIARDVHDVLAHTIAAVAVQAGVALDALDAAEPEGAREAVRRIRALTTQARPELHSALESLRGEDAARSAPQPGLGELPELVSATRSAELAVTLEIADGLDGSPPDAVAVDAAVSPVTAMTVYRIVQEALTNTVRHAHATRVDVVVRAVDGAVVVEVCDDGCAAAGATPTQGYGLAGMRERAAAVGGSVASGPRKHGGFEVRAVLPTEAAPTNGTPAARDDASWGSPRRNAPRHGVGR